VRLPSAKADEQVSRAALSKTVFKDRLDTEKQVVQDNAALRYTVRMAHRTDVQRVRNLLLMLLTEAGRRTTQNDSDKPMSFKPAFASARADGKKAFEPKKRSSVAVDAR
jgi:hypothetical protein